MALLNSSYGAAGTSGRFIRLVDGDNPMVLPDSGNYVITQNTIYPDSSSSVDVIKSDFGLENTFYFSFLPSQTYKTFQLQYRFKKRYSPSNAQTQQFDTSGAEVWTDWSEWTNEDGSTGDIADAASNVVLSEINGSNSATWQKAFNHLYSAISSYDKFLYQFRVRVYNAAANTCGAWTVCDAPLCYAPAITGYSVERISNTSGWIAKFQTNWQRNNLQIEIKNPCTSIGRDSTRKCPPITTIDKYTDTGDIQFQLPARVVVGQEEVYFRDSCLSIYEDGKVYSRYLGTSTPPHIGVRGHFKCKEHVNPETIAIPTISYDTGNQQLYCEVTSTGAAYDDVNCAIEWTSPAGVKRIEEYTMAANDDKTKWTFTIEQPPLDIGMRIYATVIKSGDWLRTMSGAVVVPSDGLVCFDSSLQGSTRLKYNQSITLNDEIAGETIDVVGRDYPVSRYGGVQSKTLKIDAQMLNSSLTGGDGWKGDLEKLTSQCDWILRIPGGEKYRVFIESLDRSTSSPTNSKLLDVSMSCKVIGDE